MKRVKGNCSFEPTGPLPLSLLNAIAGRGGHLGQSFTCGALVFLGKFLLRGLGAISLRHVALSKRAPCGCSLFARKVNLLTFVSFMTCFFYNLSNQKFLVTLSDKPKTVVWLDCVYKSLCDLISQLSNLFRFTKWTVSTKTSFRKQSNFFYLRSPKQTERNQIPRLL